MTSQYHLITDDDYVSKVEVT